MTQAITAETRMTVLSGLTVLGLGLATFAAFAPPGPWGAWGPWGTWGLALAYAAGGLPAGFTALRALWRDWVLDIDMLMVVAAIAAAAVGAALEGAVLLALFSLSNTLEYRAMGRARRAVEALMELRPRTAIRRIGATIEEVAVADLAPGDTVILRPGARVPVDGVIAAGSGEIDESTITGEAMPVAKGPGAQVFEATVNLHGVMDVTVSRSMADSTVARMIALVTQAQAARAPSERFSDWFGRRYTVAVLLGAVVAFAVFRWLLGFDAQAALYRAATLLVAASPCAIVISVPAAILSALSAAARGGVLFKGGAALERLATVGRYAFDKTGTLTTGRAEVTGIATALPEADFLALFAGIEAQSEHPAAAAVWARAQAGGIVPADVADVTALPSEGITGQDGQGTLWAGNERMVWRMGAEAGLDLHSDLARGAQTVIYLGRDDRILGAVTLADRPRATAAAALRDLRAAGVARIAMMTGDRHAVALRIGAELGLSEDEIFADLMPADKLDLVAEMGKGTGGVAFVGDGVNDAAALARADVGIAMGAAGSEVALQAADVALLSEDLTRLAAAHLLARRAARIIRQNLIFAIGMMVILVLSSLFFALPLPLAVIGHEGGTLLVVLNGLRLLADPIRADRKAGVRS